jgi:hypothetical protein
MKISFDGERGKEEIDRANNGEENWWVFGMFK